MAYSVGVDYGTQSGRVVLLNLFNGQEVASVVMPYAHGVIDHVLPTTGETLPPDWALQHPLDYIEVLEKGIPEVIIQTGINPEEIVGLGVDFTSCTVIPVLEDGTPLCLQSEWKDRKHAWPKLWKHHSAQPIADRINEAANQLEESFITRYGGRVSSEWYYPKLLEIFEEDREIYEVSDAFVEATDWIVWILTGKLMRNSCTAGYKALWSPEEGLPGKAFFLTINKNFTKPDEKLGNEFYPLGSKAGDITSEMAERLKLGKHVAVAVGNVDAMVAAPAVGVSQPGALVMVMGTSICHLALTEDEVRFPGITGVVKDGVLPGYFGYEAGQAAVGDMYEWFVKTQVPNEFFEQAKQSGQTIYEVLEAHAGKLQPGENGLLVLDWWNGNRSILGDADLTGLMIGYSLSTTVPEIYRALLESTAMGTWRILENFKQNGINIDELVACGGLPKKSPLLMQIYADVCGLPVIIRDSNEIPARGAAMYGAVAAGSEKGGFNTIEEATNKLAAPIWKVYYPDAEAHKAYQKLYGIYSRLYSFFGMEDVEIMHDLKTLRLLTHRK